MSDATINTVTTMLASLPEPLQERVIEHLREYLLDLQDEIQWDITFHNTQPQLMAAAKRAKQEIAAGYAEPFDSGQL